MRLRAERDARRAQHAIHVARAALVVLSRIDSEAIMNREANYPESNPGGVNRSERKGEHFDEADCLGTDRRRVAD